MSHYVNVKLKIIHDRYRGKPSITVRAMALGGLDSVNLYVGASLVRAHEVLRIASKAMAMAHSEGKEPEVIVEAKS